MRHAFKLCVIVIGATLGMGDRVLAQCFLCSDGNQNTAAGGTALYNNSTGASNVAAGYASLFNNTSGGNNTASGYQSLYSNTQGSGNDAVGFHALYLNTTGSYNTAYGYSTMFSNTNGVYNNAAGYNAMQSNTTGSYNNAMGAEALAANTVGSQNSGVGYGALYSNTSGGFNVAIGYFAGYNLTTGSDNVDIGSRGVAGESGAIRIGTASAQTSAYIAGIATSHITGSAVYVASNGQLGVLASSERYKTDITGLGAGNAKLEQLRPVSFHLKSEPKGALQYGLIAEEVDKVYPELVIRDDAGNIQGVRYEELAPLLLNEVQQQQKRLAKQGAELQLQSAALKEMNRQLAELQRINSSMQAAIAKLSAPDRVARR